MTIEAVEAFLAMKRILSCGGRQPREILALQPLTQASTFLGVFFFHFTTSLTAKFMWSSLQTWVQQKRKPPARKGKGE